MEDQSGDTLMEEREELMVPPTGGKPTLRTAHFLKPTQASTQNHSAIFPPSSNTIKSESNLNLLKVAYQGWRRPQTGWKKWVDQLKPLYGHVWKKAGIFDAILASTYHILKDKDSMAKLAEKWCIETNTFMFSWGETTITLEDIMVLGGYSVLGDLFISPLTTDETLRLEEKLSKAHQSIRRTTGQTTRESTWLHRFIGSGHENLEHEAFLALWLSRYVFPGNNDIVEKGWFPIAINLSKGIPMALAPAVLASIYRDLGLLKLSLVALSNLETGIRAGKETKLTLCAPLGLVQIWAWERFPTLSPEPNLIELGEPRLARWEGLEQPEVADIRKALDSAGEYFQWRPYAPVLRNWNCKNLHKENEHYVMVGPDMDSEVETLVRCWRTSELVGMDCIVQYLPHRVAMQFGFDQDLPGFVKRLDGYSAELAWSYHNRPLRDAKLYIPARLFESDVTTRYLEQWRDQLKFGAENAAGKFALLPHVVQQMMSDENDDNVLLPCQKDDPTAEKQSGDETLLSSVKNDDPNLIKPDDENLGAPGKSQTENASSDMKGKERMVSHDEEVDTSYKNGAFAGEESTEIGKQFTRAVPDKLAIKNEVEQMDARIRNLEKIVDHLIKKSCKKNQHGILGGQEKEGS